MTAANVGRDGSPTVPAQPGLNLATVPVLILMVVLIVIGLLISVTRLLVRVVMR